MGHGVFVGGAEVGLSVGFGVADGGGGNVLVGGAKIGVAVGIEVGVCVEISAGAGVDVADGVADGSSAAGVSLGRAAAVNLPSAPRVAPTIVSTSPSESGWGVGVSVGFTRSGQLQAVRINATHKTTAYRNRFPPDMGPF